MFQIPLHSKKPEEGTIDYLFDKETVVSTEGLFSFTFYLEKDITRGFLYILGIYIYSQILKKDPFAKWKILIYTDSYSYDKMKAFLEEKVSTEVPKNLPFHEIYYAERDILLEQETQKYLRLLFNNPDILFAVVSWPSQMRQKNTPKVNGFALRPFRSRAPFDFPAQLVFIRDADTLFQQALIKFQNTLIDPSRRNTTEYYSYIKGTRPVDIMNNEKRNMLLTSLIEGIGKWETDFYSEVPAIQAFIGKPPLIVGAGTISTGELYVKNWHANELLEKKAPFGIFAGFVNVVPGNPLFQTVEAWDEFVDYQTRRSYAIPKASRFQLTYGVFTPENEEQKTKELLDTWAEEAKLLGYKGNRLEANIQNKRAEYNEMKKNILLNVYSNNLHTQRIGRDEQLYLFVFLPKVLDSVYFYKIHLNDSFLDTKANYNFHQAMRSSYTESMEKGFQRSKGGKRRNRTLRLKFENRKTRRLR